VFDNGRNQVSVVVVELDPWAEWVLTPSPNPATEVTSLNRIQLWMQQIKL